LVGQGGRDGDGRARRLLDAAARLGRLVEQVATARERAPLGGVPVLHAADASRRRVRIRPGTETGPAQPLGRLLPVAGVDDAVGALGHHGVVDAVVVGVDARLGAAVLVGDVGGVVALPLLVAALG